MAKYCPECRAELQMESARVCPSCGAQVDHPPGFLESPAPRWMLILLIIFAIVLVFLAMTAFLFVSAGFFPREIPEGMQVPDDSGVRLAQPGFVIRGGIIGRGRCTDGPCHEINFVEFTLSLNDGEEPADMNGVMLFLGNGSSRGTIGRASPLKSGDAVAGEWSITHVVGANLDTSLERGDKMDIVVHLPESTGAIAAGDRFTLRIVSDNNRSTTIRMVAPDTLDPINFLR